MITGKITTTFNTVNLLKDVGKDITLAQVPVPGGGLSIGGVATVGFSAAYQVGAHATLKGQGSWDSDLKATLPGKASINIDAIDWSKSKLQGWGQFVFAEPKISAVRLGGEATISAVSQPKITFGITTQGDGPKLDVAISMSLPSVDISLKPAARKFSRLLLIQSSCANTSSIIEQGGVCPNDPNHKLVGVEASSTLSAGVIASVDKPDGGGNIWEHPIGVSFKESHSFGRKLTSIEQMGEKTSHKVSFINSSSKSKRRVCWR